MQIVARVDYGHLRPACEVARITDWVEVMTPLVMTCTLFDLISRFHNDAAVTDCAPPARRAALLSHSTASLPPQGSMHSCRTPAADGLDTLWCQAVQFMPSTPPHKKRGPACAMVGVHAPATHQTAAPAPANPTPMLALPTTH